MGKYIVQVKKTQKQEVVVDASCPAEAKKLGMAAIQSREAKSK